jgi:hypothetical protein
MFSSDILVSNYPRSILQYLHMCTVSSERCFLQFYFVQVQVKVQVQVQV